MKTITSYYRFLYALAAIFLLTIGHAKAQNLIVNGGFENNDFTGWTVSDTNAVVFSGSSVSESGTIAVISGSISAALGGSTISQTITTVPGTSYLFTCSGTSVSIIPELLGELGLDFNSLTSITVTVSGSDNQTIASKSTYLNGQLAQSFIANSTTTTISIMGGQTVPIAGNVPIVELGLDDVSVTPMFFSHPGRYTGKVTTSVTFDTLKLNHSRVATVAGRIDEGGQFFLTDDSGEEWVGFVQNDGTVEVGPLSGTGAKFKAGILHFSIAQTTLENTFGVNEHRTETFVLTRVGGL